MKNYRLAFMFLACSAAYPAFAQSALPQCENTNYDRVKGIFTVISPAPDAVNQQCLVTVYPARASAPASPYPTPYLVEGYYNIEMSGGGGGGAGGENFNRGGGGGGAGAAPSQSVQYLSSGVYKLTIGTGGQGGKPGGSTNDGNPSSLTNAVTGTLVAGQSGADVWKQTTVTAGTPHGGIAKVGESSGGDGGHSARPGSESEAESGGASGTRGISGSAGQAGDESGRNAKTIDGKVVEIAGGGGGASTGSGGTGESANENNRAGMKGDLGGGGAGGRGGFFTADDGARGGHGYIRMTMTEPQTVAPAR